VNNLKTTILLVVLTLLLILIGYLIAGPAGALVAFFIAMIMNIVSFWFSDRIVISMYRGKEVSEAEKPRLHRLINNLSQAANIPKPKVYILPLKIPNAFCLAISICRSTVSTPSKSGSNNPFRHPLLTITPYFLGFKSSSE